MAAAIRLAAGEPIDNPVASDAGGGVVYFPAGVYAITLPGAGQGGGVGPLSRGLMLRAGTNAAPFMVLDLKRQNKNVLFDEVIYGRTWYDVMPPPSGTAFVLR